jgi:hypothetical protein
MSIIMPCASYKSTIKNAMLGAFKIAPLASGPPIGGIIIDGGTWTVSRHDPSGIDVSANLAKAVVGKVLTIETPTGSNQLTVTGINTTDPDKVVISGTQANTVGVVYDDQITGLWLQSPGGQKCIDPLADQGNLTYCDRKMNGTLNDYLTEHPGEAAAAAAYIAQFCPDIVIKLPCDLTEAELAAEVDAAPDQADEYLAILEAECPECPTINWLRGYISSRDEGFIPPGPPTGDAPLPL